MVVCVSVYALRGAPPENMQTSLYYKKFFPADEVFEFATLHHPTRPENREFAVTDKDNNWRRYQSVKNATELRQLAIKPGLGSTLHLGPEYSEASHRARIPGVEATGKQLPFDLDLTDVAFLSVPKSSQAANDRFVRLIFGQVHVLKSIMSEVFGFQHFLPVYSGRRGVHLWVLDERAHRLTNGARKSICEMINPPMNKRDGRLFYRQAIQSHPSFSGPEISNAIDAVRTRVVEATYKSGGLGLLDTPHRAEDFLDNLFFRPTPEPSEWAAHEEICEATIRKAIANIRGGPAAFRTLETVIQTGMPVEDPDIKSTPIQFVYKALWEKYNDVIFSLCWPTLDVGPSAQVSHCIKLPFSVHGTTNRISLPVDQLLPYPLGGATLPPVVTQAALAGDDGPAHDTFFKSVAVLRAAIAFARRGVRPAPGIDDIEDLAGRQPKSPRCL